MEGGGRGAFGASPSMMAMMFLLFVGYLALFDGQMTIPMANAVFHGKNLPKAFSNNSTHSQPLTFQQYVLQNGGVGMSLANGNRPEDLIVEDYSEEEMDDQTVDIEKENHEQQEQAFLAAVRSGKLQVVCEEEIQNGKSIFRKCRDVFPISSADYNKTTNQIGPFPVPWFPSRAKCFATNPCLNTEVLYGARVKYDPEFASGDIEPDLNQTNYFNFLNGCEHKFLDLSSKLDRTLTHRSLRSEGPLHEVDFIFGLVETPIIAELVGTKDSIQTLITNMDGNNIDNDISPSLPTFDENNLLENGWQDRKNNFDLFALDFIPKLNKWRENYGDYYQTFISRGSYKECNMTLQFVGEKVHRCKAEWVDIDMRCPGPTFFDNEKLSKCKLNPTKRTETFDNSQPGMRINICEYEQIEKEGTGYSSLTRDIQSSGTENETTNFNKVVLFPYDKASFLRFTLEYNNRVYKDKSMKSFESGSQMQENTLTQNINKWTFKVRQGCIIVGQQLFINCNGWRTNVGQFRFQVRELKYDVFNIA